MRILIKSEKRSFKILFPTALLSSRLGARIISKGLAAGMNADVKGLPAVADNKAVKFDTRAAREFFKEFKRYKKKHGTFLLFEAVDKSGDGIKIYL